MYYSISEETARRAQEAYSFRDYIPGSATAEYRRMVDRAAELAARCKQGKDPEDQERIDHLLDAYARRLADNINAQNRNTASCPSVMIAGPANFPVRKKQRQNAREDTLMEEYRQIEKLLDKMQSIGTGGIQSGDPHAVEKLEKKLKGLESLQEIMKSANSYYRKHNTLEGCPVLSENQIKKLTEAMARSWRASPKPFESYELTNNGAEIRRLRKRIETLQQAKAQPTSENEIGDIRIVENTETMRIQIFFPDKPDSNTRALLKSNGFRWAPSCGAWQRQLTSNGRAAAKAVLNSI